MSYLRPIKAIQCSQFVKKSQFISYLDYVNSKQDAIRFIKSIKAQNPNANHHCYCYITSNPEDRSSWGYSDDGEPKGTAGLPMFQVLNHSNIGNICIVVTRYFGGIKLGTGGIARAYSSSVSMLLKEITTQEVHPQSECTLFIPFHLTGFVEHILNRYSAINIENRLWTDTGQQLSFSIEDSILDAFAGELSIYKNELVIQYIHKTS